MAGQMEGCVHDYRTGWRRSQLRCGITIKMFSCPFMPAKCVCYVCTAPAVESHPPRNRAVQIRRRFPNGVAGNAQNAAEGIDVLVRCLDSYTTCNLHSLSFRFFKLYFQFCIWNVTIVLLLADK